MLELRKVKPQEPIEFLVKEEHPKNSTVMQGKGSGPGGVSDADE